MARKPRDTASSVSRRKFLAASTSLGLLGAAGCTQSNPGDGRDGTTGTGGTTQLSGEIVVKGSSTVFPVSQAVSEEFREEYDGVNPTVDSTGTGGGFNNFFCEGNSDVNGASRPITDSEEEQCSGNGVTPIEFEIAGDALTVAVNNDADWVDCLSYDQLARIWQPDGAETWRDLDPDWPDEPFELYGPASTSGTFDWFTENVVGEAGSMREDYEATEDDNRIIEGIENSEYAMGFFGYAYYKENSDRVKAVKVTEESGGTCTAPSLENAKTGDYPMARPLYIYVAESSLADPAVAEFVEFYLTKAETDLVEEIGYVPSSVEQRDENLSRLEEAVPDE